ncbi:MAG TPA: hypothetical protein VEL74_19375 [Thermoanaerobaculia bacterium]|nr:hypothetical protein [Thermoanaerobaculia bacterium]
MARQNYQHGKRQRDLAKKQKREEKLAQKKERKKNPLGAPIENPDQPVDPDQPVGLLEDEDDDDGDDESEDETQDS